MEKSQITSVARTVQDGPKASPIYHQNNKAHFHTALIKHYHPSTIPVRITTGSRK